MKKCSYQLRAVLNATLAKVNTSANNNEHCNQVPNAFEQCPDFEKIINEWNTKDPCDLSWKELKNFVPTKYTKLKLKADKFSVKAASFSIATKIDTSFPILKD